MTLGSHYISSATTDLRIILLHTERTQYERGKRQLSMVSTRGSWPRSGSLPHCFDSLDCNARYGQCSPNWSLLHVCTLRTHMYREKAKKQALSNISTRPKLLANYHAGVLDSEHSYPLAGLRLPSMSREQKPNDLLLLYMGTRALVKDTSFTNLYSSTLCYESMPIV
jgi:hypothetical protein